MRNKKQGVKSALTSKDKIVADRDVEAKTPKDRPKRVPLTQAFKLEIPEGIKKEGYAYRFIKDKPERVHAFEQAWWTPVHDGQGRAIRKPDGGGGYLLLYRIEEKYFNEDLEVKRKHHIDMIAERAKLQKGDRNSSEYVPEGHEGVVTIKN